MELAAKQKDSVEALNQELDDQDHELSLERSRYFTHTTAWRQLYEQERQHMPRGICAAAADGDSSPPLAACIFMCI